MVKKRPPIKASKSINLEDWDELDYNEWDDDDIFEDDWEDKFDKSDWD